MSENQPVSFIDISSHLGKVRSRIDLIGVELEGGWTKLPKGTEALHPDGSVTFPEFPSNRTPEGKVIHVGEAVSPPMPLSMLNAWITQHYPTFVNKTCGLHLHMSFKSPLVYQRLMDPTYQKTVLEFVRRWAETKRARGTTEGTFPDTHPIYERLKGTSQYCQDKFWADQQAAQRSKSYQHNRDGNRYTVVNYCYGLHQTVEIRLLPMFATAEIGEEAIRLLIDITNAWLVVGRKIPKLDASWKLEEDRISEERIECV